MTLGGECVKGCFVQWLSLDPSLFWRGVIPKPGAVQPGEGSPTDRRMRAGDPSLRLKNGSA
jgi:hypothetical protein